MRGNLEASILADGELGVADVLEWVGLRGVLLAARRLRQHEVLLPRGEPAKLRPRLEGPVGRLLLIRQEHFLVAEYLRDLVVRRGGAIQPGRYSLVDLLMRSSVGDPPRRLASRNAGTGIADCWPRVVVIDAVHRQPLNQFIVTLLSLARFSSHYLLSPVEVIWAVRCNGSLHRRAGAKVLRHAQLARVDLGARLHPSRPLLQGPTG